MPSFKDMLEVVDLLKVKAIEVDELRCVAVRNRNSKCRKCAETCITGAITVSNNEISIDASACVNCGCCVAVCPTEALKTVEPASASVASRVAATSDAATGLAVIACERKAARQEGDPERYTAVPCLGYLEEEGLVALAAAGLADIVLVDGDCASCKYGAASPCVDAVVDEAAKLLEAAGADAIVTRASEFPPEVVDKAKASNRGASRRGIMRQTGSYMKTVAGNVATKALEEQLGGKEKEPTNLRDRLRVGKGGRIPPFEPTENYRLLDAMTKLVERSNVSVSEAQNSAAPESQDAGANEGATLDAASSIPMGATDALDTRHFGSVSIEPSKCSGCGMCVLFGPTEALKYAKYDEPDDPDRRYLEFQAADCTQCMLCKDVCLRYCLEVDGKVSLDELLDFEPRLLEIAAPQKRVSILDLKNRNKK